MSAWSSEGNATLGEVIAHLKTLPPEMVVERGWNDCYSYRGYYEDLAFHAAANVTVADMLRIAEDARGQTFQGWKGGDFTMHNGTDCWLTDEPRNAGVPVVLPGKAPEIYVLPEGSTRDERME